MRPLDGIRILDFTRFQQGPWATVMLADMGAEVIKVEARQDGDLGRSIGLQPDGFCGYFEAHNRGKKSITLDLTKPAAGEIVRRLVATADVVVHNFRPGVMEKLGFSYEALKAINPKVIYAAGSGFGAQGPLANRPSFDVIGQAMGGIMVAQGGGPGCDPQPVLPGVADQVGGMNLAFGIAMALIARDRFGVGQQLDTSLYGSQVALQAFQLTSALRSGRQGARRDSATFTIYPAGDGLWLTVAYLDPTVFPRFCTAMGRPDLVTDPRFADIFDRDANNEALKDELRRTFAGATRKEWLERLIAHDIPCSPVQDYLEVGDDAQARANGYIREVDHPNLGTIRVVGQPVVLSETPTEVGIAPELGQHTEEVLQALGYDWDEIARLKDAAVI